MEKDIVFTDWREKYRCVIVNSRDIYVLGRWETDRWKGCLKLLDPENDVAVISKIVDIKPIMKGMKVEAIEFYKMDGSKYE